MTTTDQRGQTEPDHARAPLPDLTTGKSLAAVAAFLAEEEACQVYRKTARLTAMTPDEQDQAVDRFLAAFREARAVIAQAADRPDIAVGTTSDYAGLAKVAERVTKRLTDAWEWLPDEPEAVRLGVNFAQAAALLVAGTSTTPDTLLDALIDASKDAQVDS